MAVPSLPVPGSGAPEDSCVSCVCPSRSQGAEASASMRGSVYLHTVVQRPPGISLRAQHKKRVEASCFPCRCRLGMVSFLHPPLGGSQRRVQTHSSSQHCLKSSLPPPWDWPQGVGDLGYNLTGPRLRVRKGHLLPQSSSATCILRKLGLAATDRGAFGPHGGVTCAPASSCKTELLVGHSLFSPGGGRKAGFGGAVGGHGCSWASPLPFLGCSK